MQQKNKCSTRYAPFVMYAVPSNPPDGMYDHNVVIVDNNPYHPNQRLNAAREEIERMNTTTPLDTPNVTVECDIFDERDCITMRGVVSSGIYY